MFGKNGVWVTGVSRITLPNPVATRHREALRLSLPQAQALASPCLSASGGSLSTGLSCRPLVICLQLSYLVGTIAEAAKGGIS